MSFSPDYTQIIKAARNEHTDRLPLYEHNISPLVAQAITNKPLLDLMEGNKRDKEEYFRIYSRFCRDHGYDTVPFEGCVTELIQGGEGLCGRVPGIIKNREDLNNFDWKSIPEKFITRFSDSYEAMIKTMPEGMKAIGGVGNGPFELVQDFLPLTELSYLQIDEPEVYADLWKKIETLLTDVWAVFLERWSDAYAVCRFGDDLGFQSSTLIQPSDIKTYILPSYKRIVSMVHEKNKLFLLHSCGCLFDIMEEIIDTGIDAKHSNEDNIAPFSKWVDLYGEKIGNFGGIEMNVLCLEDEKGITEYVNKLLREVGHKPGIAIGSGNQIADYIPPEGFIAMTEAVRKFRGE